MPVHGIGVSRRYLRRLHGVLAGSGVLESIIVGHSMGTRFTAPVLVLRGAGDPVASAHWCRLLAELAATSRLVEIPGTGHVVQHNRSAEVAEAIMYLAGLPGAASEAPQEFRA